LHVPWRGHFAFYQDSEFSLRKKLQLLLYLLYTADLPTSPESTTGTFADNTAVVAMDSDPAIASQKLQTDLLAIQDWFKKWKMKSNKSKFNHVKSLHEEKYASRSI
jgi:hypothetical protein